METLLVIMVFSELQFSLLTPFQICFRAMSCILSKHSQTRRFWQRRDEGSRELPRMALQRLSWRFQLRMQEINWFSRF